MNMLNPILNQLARSTLLPDEIATAILDGGAPPLKEVVTHLLIAAMDCEGMTASDAKKFLEREENCKASSGAGLSLGNSGDQ
jgi:hypothetical protein